MTSEAQPATRQKRVGILDVARRAGVSRQTVTRAMNDMPGISAETKVRVLETARELRYRPSRFGRGLVKQDSMTLGLVVVDLMNPYFAELASKMLAVADQSGWTVLVQEIARDRQREERVLAGLATQVDAIVGYVLLDDDTVDDLVGDLPVVRLTDRELHGRRPWVLIDNASGMATLLDRLIDSGRRKVVMVDCPIETGISPRARAYRDLYAARGFTPTVIDLPHSREPDIESAEHAIERAVGEDPSIDAVIGFNDVVAIGALKALARIGIDVPGRCAVVGIDGLPFGELVSPRLTTLTVEIGEVARVLFDTMVDTLAGHGADRPPEPSAVVGHSLTIRDSFRPTG